MNARIRIVLGLVAMLAVGLVAGYLMAPGERQGASPDLEERRPLFYRNPMNPAVTSPIPAKDEMGMDYVPVYREEGSGQGSDGPGSPSGTVRIDPATAQSIGVRTAVVERRTLTRVIHTSGRVDYDEERLARLHPKTEGWIEKLFIDATGQPVQQGTILLSIYSPDLVQSQEEYLLAYQNMKAVSDSPFEHIRKGAVDLLESSHQRLHMLDVPEHQIHELETTRQVRKSLHIHSPFDGVVVAVGARQGQYVTPETELYSIADLSEVWVYVDVFDAELPWVNAGDHAEMTLKGVPGRTFGGLIRYVYPYAEKETRTVKVRLEFANPGGLLKPETFADVTIHAGRLVNALVIPTEAVLRSGARDHVFVVRGEGRFEPREVTLGMASDNLVQVLKGLKQGDVVVTSAQFLIDSESKLREATAKMMEVGDGQAAPEAPAPTPPARSAPARKKAPPAPHPAPATPAVPGHDMPGMDMAPTPGHDMPGMDMGK